MGIVFLRFAPLLVGLGTYLGFSWQWREPKLYPWPIVGVGLLYAILLWHMTRTHADRFALRWYGVPGLLLIFSGGAAAVLVERTDVQIGLTFLVSVMIYMMLELLFLLLYHPSRYPVHGLTYLQLAIVPCANAFLGWGAIGVRVFAKATTPSWVIPLVFCFMNALLFGVITYSEETVWQKHAWTVFGATAGLFLGFLLLFLPLALPAQALIAALFLVLPLRFRRYAVHPRPSLATQYIEGALFFVLLAMLLLLSRWA